MGLGRRRRRPAERDTDVTLIVFHSFQRPAQAFAAESVRRPASVGWARSALADAGARQQNENHVTSFSRLATFQRYGLRATRPTGSRPVVALRHAR
jgi:hypothetical protein